MLSCVSSKKKTAMKTILYLIVCAGCLGLGLIGCSTQRETMTTTTSTSATHAETETHSVSTPHTGGYGSGGSRGY